MRNLGQADDEEEANMEVLGGATEEDGTSHPSEPYPADFGIPIDVDKLLMPSTG
jgi:hypothetical protein